jgi:hypothetical protein
MRRAKAEKGLSAGLSTAGTPWPWPDSDNEWQMRFGAIVLVVAGFAVGGSLLASWWRDQP